MTLETLINALAYELGLLFSAKYPNIRLNPWFQRMMHHCEPDWVRWKTGKTMQEVDEQISALHAEWTAAETKKLEPVYTELPPDGSKAQELLGGEMRLSAPWKTDDTTN